MALARYGVIDDQQQAAGLRRQFVERAAQHLVRQAVGDFDIGERHLDVGNGPAAMRDGFYRPLKVRRLADALLERKVISARRARSLLYKAQRKELRRARIVAEKDHRNQQAWAAA